MAETKKMATTQTNIAVETDVLAQFEAFCAARGMTKGYAASAAMLHLLTAELTDREKMLLQLDRWVAGDRSDVIGRIGEVRTAAKPKPHSKGKPPPHGDR